MITATLLRVPTSIIYSTYRSNRTVFLVPTYSGNSALFEFIFMLSLDLELEF